MRTLKFAYLIGEGIGEDFYKSVTTLMESIRTIQFEAVPIRHFRDPGGILTEETINIFREIGIGLKGPTRTQEGVGARSANVMLRQSLGLYQNVRPIFWIPGIPAPVKNPMDLNIVIFRENTEDTYAGIEFEAGSEKAARMMDFLFNELQVPRQAMPDPAGTGIGIKPISQLATFNIMNAALEYAIRHHRKRITIAHKGNIMKYTEGAFMKWCLEYAKKSFRSKVYCYDEADAFSDKEKDHRIYIDIVTADDAFAQLLLHPKRFDVIVTPNLNGDYLSDAAAGQVGGVPLAAGGNIGDTCAIFEAIGGTADAIAGKDIANPTAIFMALAMMLEHRGFSKEAKVIQKALKALFTHGIGTADLNLAETVSTSDFTRRVCNYVREFLLEPVL